MNARAVNKLAESGKADEVLALLKKQAYAAPRPYFNGCVIGYIIAIITTVVIMMVFEHG